MKVIISKYAGFCSGVKRAIEIAESAPKPCLVLGDLIHNTRVNARLENEGIFSFGKMPTSRACSFLIAAHGINKQHLQEVTGDIKDATCPNVKKLIDIAKNCNGTLLVVGNRDHIEVKNVVSYAKKSIVLSSKEELEAVFLDNSIEYTVIGQTTISSQQFSYFVNILQNKAIALGVRISVVDTLCGVVEKRIDELCLYAEKYPVIVVGDKKSSNCNTLYKMALEKNRAFLVESVEELESIRIRSCFITTASSTSYEQVGELISFFKSFDKGLELVFLS